MVMWTIIDSATCYTASRNSQFIEWNFWWYDLHLLIQDWSDISYTILNRTAAFGYKLRLLEDDITSKNVYKLFYVLKPFALQCGASKVMGQLN